MDRATRSLIAQHVGLDRWEQVRARGRVLAEETAKAERKLSALQWAWGDLSLEAVPAIVGGTGWGTSCVVAFLEDCRCPYSIATLRTIRTTCGGWPKQHRTEASFAVHSILKSHPNRFTLITPTMTTDEARRALGMSTPRPSLRRATAIDCASAARSWIRSARVRLDGEPTEDVLGAVADVWREATNLAESLGILDGLIDERAGEALAV